MADPVLDNADFAVDELKRKARRRLLGAIVLALAAATILPMLLEQDQKPLGEDVSVRIPPVDGGKFVTRLGTQPAQDGPSAARPDAGRTSSADGAPTPEPAPAAAAAAAPDQAASAPQPAAKAASAAPAPATASPRPAEPKAATAGAATASADAAPPANAALTSAAAPPASGADAAVAAPADAGSSAANSDAKAQGYVVQLGAFTDTYGASALARKLKKGGYPAFTEPVETSRGKLWRVRVGGYATRQAAVDARNKLKADGHDGVVVSASK
jgi:DedD protein